MSTTIGHYDPIAINRATQVLNSYLARDRDLARAIKDPRRSINDDCGFPETSAISIELLREMYDRGGVASRVVNLFPEESWTSFPDVFEDPMADNETEFEKAFKQLDRSLLDEDDTEESLYEGMGMFWDYLFRADKLSGIGYYGALMLGFDDGESLDTPAPGFEGSLHNGGEVRLSYMVPLDESSADVSSIESDRTSPRFNKPTRYTIDFGLANRDRTTIPGNVGSMSVHWSRVIHIPGDGAEVSDIVSPPRMRAVLNNLLSIDKIMSGDGEMWWRGALPLTLFETHPQLGGDVTVDVPELSNQAEQLMNSLQRWMLLRGMAGKNLAPTVSDPTPHMDVQINEICIKLACPRRIFEGSERGELASGQDQKAWDLRMKNRQDRYIVPRIIVPTIQRLIRVGVLPKPKQWGVSWDGLDMVDPKTKAEVAQLRTATYASYIEGGVENLIQPMDFLTREMGFDRDDAEAIIDATVEVLSEYPPTESSHGGGGIPPAGGTFDDQGNPIDAQGNPVDSKGNPIDLGQGSSKAVDKGGIVFPPKSGNKPPNPSGG